jgi:hypothetical protein
MKRGQVKTVPRMQYADPSLETYAERPSPRVYTGGGLRAAQGEALRRVWATPEGEAARQALSDTGRRVAGPAFYQAAQRIGVGRAYADAASRVNLSASYRQVWGSF